MVGNEARMQNASPWVLRLRLSYNVKVEKDIQFKEIVKMVRGGRALMGNGGRVRVCFCSCVQGCACGRVCGWVLCVCVVGMSLCVCAPNVCSVWIVW